MRMIDAEADCGVDDVIITGALSRRPARPPDHKAENEALRSLGGTMAAEPDKMLRTLAEAAMALTRSQSAGIGLIERGGGERIPRRAAAAGLLAEKRDGAAPAEAGLCGEAMARDQMLLVERPERAFPALREAQPRIDEALLVPFHVGGGPGGVIWAVKHGAEARFDAEDARVLQSLAGFASAACRVAVAVEDADAASNKLEAREQPFRLMADAVPQIVWITDPEGRIEFFNKQWSDYTGTPYQPTTAAEVAANHVHPDDRERTVAAFREAQRTGGTFLVEHRIRSAAGAYRWFLVRAQPYRDPEGGEIVRWFGSSTDIHDRKLAEEALRGSEERFRTIAESIDSVFYMTDLDSGRLEYLSPSYERVWGRPAAELVADLSLFPETIHPDDRGDFDLNKAAQQRGEPVASEYRIVRPDGSIRWIYDRSFPVPGARGRRSAGVATDVTARKAAETALRESEERYRLIVENARDYAIIITDPDDRIVDWLPGAEAVFGWTKEEATGKPAGIIFTEQDRERGAPQWEVRTAAEEGVAPDVRWHQRKDGSHVFIEGTVTPLRNEDGGIRGYLKIGQDVSERRSAQEALEASERRMRSLVTGLPLMVFRSWSSGERIWGSPQWIDYTGLSFEDSLGFGWLDAIHPDDRKASMDAWEGAEKRGGYYVEHRVRNAASGAYCWHQTRAIPLHDGGARVREWLGTSNDVEELRRLQRHQQVLLAELQHRVRNTLSIVRSIARRTADTSDDVEEMATHLDGRLGAFSRVQTMVTRNPDVGVDLMTLVEDELRAHAAREGEALRIRGPAVSLKPRPAESISLAIHELATNAVKYGALTDGKGRIDVRWTREKHDGGEWLELLWEENGLDLPAEEPALKGFGLELLTRSLPYDLRARTEVEFRREGLRFSMTLPLGPDVVAE